MSNNRNDWMEFLQQQGAIIAEETVQHFGDATKELSQGVSGNVMIPLTHRTLLRASGGDSGEFLQGQTSNDVRLVDDGHHQLSAYCTPKGRMLTLFTLLMRDGDFFLQLPAELTEAVQKRLTMFIMRSDVTLQNMNEEFGSFGVSGPQADTLLQQALGEVPEKAGESLSVDGVTVLCRPGAAPRFICIAPHQRLRALWQQLAAEITPAGAGVWELLEIRAGLPDISSGSVEAFVPQMVNLQLVDGVNFKKGCYPGQEVVARMQYLGKLKRRMYHAAIDGAEVPAVGTDLYSPGSGSGQGAGKVVRAAATPDGGCELLVVAESSVAEQHPLFLRDAEGPQLRLLELPYPVEQGG